MRACSQIWRLIQVLLRNKNGSFEAAVLLQNPQQRQHRRLLQFMA
jgi:hypothetical protein